MAFKLGDLIVDRIQYGVAETTQGDLLYTLTQLSDASIEITADSTDAVDQTGTLIKRFWRAKSGTLTATNAMLSLPILGSKSGSDPVLASENAPIVMPKVTVVKAGATLTLEKGFVEGSAKVYAIDTDGAMGKGYKLGTSASATEFAISGTTLTPPTDKDETQFIVKYNRSVTVGTAIYNKANEFPKTIRLTLKVLCVDPCEADVLRAAYIVMNSFQPSPETTISLTTDGTLDYNGDLQVDYCSPNKELYSIYFTPDDEEK